MKMISNGCNGYNKDTTVDFQHFNKIQLYGITGSNRGNSSGCNRNSTAPVAAVATAGIYLKIQELVEEKQLCERLFDNNLTRLLFSPEYLFLPKSSNCYSNGLTSTNLANNELFSLLITSA